VDLVRAPMVDLAAPVSAASGRPLITYVDHATGARTDLDAAALASWVARTASLLRDACQLRAADRVAILAPPHWQTAVVVLGAWSTGLALSFRPWSTAGLTPATDDALDAVFVARNRVDSWLEEVPAARHRFVLGLGSGAGDLDDVPHGYRDFLADVRRQPDVAPAYWTTGRGAGLLDRPTDRRGQHRRHDVPGVGRTGARHRIVVGSAGGRPDPGGRSRRRAPGELAPGAPVRRSFYFYIWQ
jgi:uncharacterized protein (TIGR03089 family)